MDKKTVEKQVKDLTKELEKQIKTLKNKAIDTYESEKVQAVLTKLQKKSVKFLESVKNKVSNLWDYYSDPDEIAKIVKNVKTVALLIDSSFKLLKQGYPISKQTGIEEVSSLANLSHPAEISRTSYMV